MTEQDVLDQIDIANTRIYHYIPEDWCSETSESLYSLLQKKIIKKCNEEQPNFINSSFAYTRVELTPVVIQRQSYMWLDASGV